ncbi:MAG: hypothetical protein ACHQ1G_00170 [Planctomycetota bacterium]
MVSSTNGNGVGKRLFKPGNPGGPGNPFVKHLAACRAAFHGAVTPDELVKRWLALDRSLVRVLDRLNDPDDTKLKVHEYCALMREARDTLVAISDRAMGRPEPVQHVPDEDEIRSEIDAFLELIKDPELHDRIVGTLLAARAGSNGNGHAKENGGPQ